MKISAADTLRFFSPQIRAVVFAGLVLLPCSMVSGELPELTDTTAPERRVVVETVASRLETSYVLADVAGKMAEFLRAQARLGTYDHFTDQDSFATQLTTDLQKSARTDIFASVTMPIRRK